MIEDVSEKDKGPSCIVTAVDIHGENVDTILHPSGIVVAQMDDRWPSLASYWACKEREQMKKQAENAIKANKA